MNKSASVEKFYTSRAWRRTRADFIQARGGICEECWARGIVEAGSKERPLEVHHKVPLTDSNVRDPEVALSWDNLQLLCKDCHDKKRAKEAQERRWTVDAEGRVAPL